MMAVHWKYIVWHTAAHATKQGVALDTTAAEIDDWHRHRNTPFRKGGYHRVIRFNGELDGDATNTRTYTESGAHVAGANSYMIGYCFSGHGDFAPLTAQQLDTGIRIALQDMQRFNIPVENVIGHNEVNRIIQRDGLTRVSPVNKSCPGHLVDMALIRRTLAGIRNTEKIALLEAARIVTNRFPLAYATSLQGLTDIQIADVKRLQETLAAVGLYTGKIDGIAGRRTSDGVHGMLGFRLKGDTRT